ncbi:MAG: hypothetical protein GEU98_11160 [Pseudonocardiaceae bacterium]|nr:hypothetical protein [Pseudonocardiaceae bacterium]
MNGGNVENPLATLQTVDGRPVLRFERRLAHPPEKVWRAVTDPAEMAHWFPATVHTELKIGATIRFDVADFDVAGDAASGEIIELDPPKVYAFRWDDSVLRFELIPDDVGCLLVFTHILGGEGFWGDRRYAARHAAGWDGCLDVLIARLDGRTVPDVWSFRRAEQYVDDFRLGEGEVREDEGGYLVRFERDLLQPAEEVWATLVGDAGPAAGEQPPVRCTHGYFGAGVVTAVQPGRMLEYQWLHDGETAGRVRFELEQQELLGSWLVVTQTVPAPLAARLPIALAAWQTHLELLFAALHGDVRCPWPSERTEELERRYARVRR